VTFRCLDVREGLPCTVGAAAPPALLESLELAALGPRPDSAGPQPDCPLRTDAQWPKGALGVALAGPQERAFLSFGERS
jgi:hypothetical protein